MNTIRNKFIFLRTTAEVTFKEWAAFRTHSLVSIFVGPAYLLVQYMIWTAVYGTKTDIGGVGLNQMLTYYGVSTLIGYLTMDFADWNLQMLIRTGKYITFALRPMHHRFFALSQKVGHRVLGFVFEFLPVLFIFVVLFRINLIPVSFFWSLLSIVFSFLMTFYINYCIGLAAFWLINNSGLRNIIYGLSSVFSGALIPLTFFPQWMQNIVFYLPFQYTIYVPSMVFLGGYQFAGRTYNSAQLVAVQGIYVILMSALSEVLYRLGTKRFSGVGA